MSRNLAAELDQLLADCGARVAIGLRAQGHLPTVRKMLEEGSGWGEIGKAIGWHPVAAKEWFEREDLIEKVREACAQRVARAGCVCLALESAGVLDSAACWDLEAGIWTVHDPRCPKALAEALRRMGA